MTEGEETLASGTGPVDLIAGVARRGPCGLGDAVKDVRVEREMIGWGRSDVQGGVGG